MAQRKFIIDGGFKTEDASELLANLTMGGTIDMADNKLLNVAAPTAAGDGASKNYVDDSIANIVDSAPGALDTLNELAAAMGDDANFSATVTNSLAAKAATTYVDAQITAANAYTDTAEVDAVATAATAAQTKADDAQANAQAFATNADLAVSAAWLAADTAQTTSINTAWAAADATAINTAASDATTKANAAQAAAEATAAAANTALATAQNTAWAAGDAATLASAQSYADTAEADAVATAAAASAAAIAALVDSAPGTLDTLNELAAALGDDANYAASVTSAISAAQTAAQNYADANDANTTYTAGNGLSLGGTEFTMSGSYTGSFTATGDITAYSDESLKTNIQVIDGALGRVEAIRGVTFDRIEDGSTSTGVVAHELEAVLPEAVHTDENGLKSVAYGNITGLLIEAVKELSAQVAELKAK